MVCGVVNILQCKGKCKNCRADLLRGNLWLIVNQLIENVTLTREQAAGALTTTACPETDSEAEHNRISHISWNHVWVTWCREHRLWNSSDEKDDHVESCWAEPSVTLVESRSLFVLKECKVTVAFLGHEGIRAINEWSWWCGAKHFCG